jgi:uncharacterized protein YecA (UPF0149 family)
MRECYKTRNFNYLLGLIEEAQNMANRMEAALWDVHDYERLHQEIKELKEEKKALKKELGKKSNRFEDL